MALPWHASRWGYPGQLAFHCGQDRNQSATPLYHISTPAQVIRFCSLGDRSGLGKGWEQRWRACSNTVCWTPRRRGARDPRLPFDGDDLLLYTDGGFGPTVAGRPSLPPPFAARPLTDQELTHRRRLWVVCCPELRCATKKSRGAWVGGRGFSLACCAASRASFHQRIGREIWTKRPQSLRILAVFRLIWLTGTAWAIPLPVASWWPDRS